MRVNGAVLVVAPFFCLVRSRCYKWRWLACCLNLLRCAKMTALNIPEHLLPAKLKEVTLLCGHPVAMALVTHWGGCCVSIPRHPNRWHKLSELLGWDSFRRLCASFGGEILYVAKCTVAKLAARNAAIRHERRNGATLATLARRYDLTERRCCAICSA